MKRWVPLALFTGILLATTRSPGQDSKPAAQTPAPGTTSQAGPGKKFDQAAALEALRASIKGREDLPASEVFGNIQMMNRVPADRLLRVMEMGYARSLGVSCDFCHDPAHWDSDDKKEKLIARRMMRMTAVINDSLLKSIKELEDEKPAVNCTTCHRGQTKPALNLEGPPKEGPAKQN